MAKRKPRKKPKKPRNLVVVDMILTRKGGRHKDKRIEVRRRFHDDELQERNEKEDE